MIIRLYALTTILLVSSAPVLAQSSIDRSERSTPKKRVSPPPVSSTTLQTIAISEPNNGEWVCERQLGAAITHPRGRFKLADNMNRFGLNWRTGRDWYLHNTFGKLPETGAINESAFVVKTQCLNGTITARDAQTNMAVVRYVGGSYRDGTLKIDAMGDNDMCVVDSSFDEFVSPCKSGFTPDHNQKKCVRDASTSTWVKVRRPAGKWLPYHNTNNYHLVTTFGDDYYLKTGKADKPINRVKTHCFNSVVSTTPFGTRKVDYEGKADWCVKQAPSAAITEPMICATPYYALVQR